MKYPNDRFYNQLLITSNDAECSFQVMVGTSVSSNGQQIDRTLPVEEITQLKYISDNFKCSSVKGMELYASII